MSRKKKYIEKLTREQKRSLRQGYKTGKNFSFRRKCHAILLSNEMKSVSEIAEFFRVGTKSIYNWLKVWETQGIKGLQHKPGQGRPPKLKLEDKNQVKIVKTLVENEPKNLKRVVGQLKSELNIDLSKKTLKRFLKNLDTNGNVSDAD